MLPLSLLTTLGQDGLHTVVSLPPHLVVIIALLAALVLKTIYRCVFSPLAGFPGPKVAAATKLFEAYHMILKRDWLETLQQLHDEYGPVVRIGPNELHFVDHEFCLSHHKRHDLGKCTNYYGLLSTLLGGIPSPHGHAERKSIIQPLFSGGILNHFSQTTLNTHLDTLHDRLDAVDPAKPLNMTHVLFAYTSDVMVSYLVDKDMGYLRQPELAPVHESLRAFSSIELATVLRCMPPVKKAFDVFPSLRKMSPLGWLDELISSHLRVIVKDDAEDRHEKDTASVLSRLWDRLGSVDLVAQEAGQAVFIGNESLLSNLTCLLHFLMLRPECQSRLRAEFDTLDIGVYGHRIWRDPKVLQLPYLDAVCRESTRLSAPSWHRQPRQIDEPVEYHGAIIPPRTSLSFTLKLLERDATLYPQPERFMPERWLGQSPEAKQARASSVTFGTGTRTCLGQFIARQVLRKTVAALVYNFDILPWSQARDEAEGYRYLNTYPTKGYEGFLEVSLRPRFGVLSE